MEHLLDGLGDEGFYGWPYCYWGQAVDDRVPQDAALVATAITPEGIVAGGRRCG